MHLHLYIDTNIYLDLLATQAESSPDLEKLVALCENGSVDIYLPQQTEEEYFENREDVIASTLENIKKITAVGALPKIVENHAVGEKAARLRRELSEQAKIVSAWYENAAKEENLPFDRLFSKIRDISIKIPKTPKILEKAKHRAASHIAPGKGSDLGDRVIWESLLDAGSFADDLHIITKDGGFRSPLDGSKPRATLIKEWSSDKWGDLLIYSSLEEFSHVAGKTDAYTRATEIGRAIWTLENRSDDAGVDQACLVIQKYMTQLSVKQAKLIANNARLYYDRVFITTEIFDDMVSSLWKLYSKHLGDSEKLALSQIVSASGEEI